MRALALFSGGLDSMLACKLITSQNIEVTALYIDIGFGNKKDIYEKLQKRAFMCGASFELINAREEYLKDVLFNPKYGYGKHFNPCIDCHGFMFKKALSLLHDKNASFLISGEVLGQRPMSQRNEALKSVLKLSGDEENLILRPLSAKLLNPTKPELEGWVEREKLLDISGRGRETQLALAKKFNFSEFDTPAGGCLLTIDSFAKKIKDFIAYDKMNVDDIDLLKFGRHLRLPNGAKLIIGRNEDDNEKLKKIKNAKFDFVLLDGIVGPVSLLSKNANDEDLNLAVKLILTYAKTDSEKKYSVAFGKKKILQKPFLSKNEAKKYFVV